MKKSIQNEYRDSLSQLPLVGKFEEILYVLTTGYVPEYRMPEQDQSVSEVSRLPQVIVSWRLATKDDLTRYQALLRTVTAAMHASSMSFGPSANEAKSILIFESRSPLSIE